MTIKRPTQAPVVTYETLKRWGVGVLVMLALVFIFDFFDNAELMFYGTEQAFRGTFSAPMRMLGIPHFVIGILFMLTSASLHSRRSYGHVAIALLLSTLIISVVYQIGGPYAHPAILPLVFLGFLIHEFRDQFSFYQHDRLDRKVEDRSTGRTIAILLVGFSFVLFAIGWSLQFLLPNLVSYARFLPGLEQLSTATYTIYWLGPVAASLFVALLCVTRVRQENPGESVRQLMYRDRVIWLVYLGTITVVLLLLPFKGKAETILLLHVVSWWVFATRNLHTSKQTPRFGNRKKGWFNRVKRTQAGFQIFHWGLVLLMGVLSLYWFQTLGAPAGHVLEFVVTPAAFYYWTIFHVTMSFVPK